MFVGNRLKAGDFLTFVPVGLPLTLQYNEQGNLHKIYYGMEDRNVDLTDKLLKKFIEAKTVPYHISILKGTTWVKGVLYTSKIFYDADGKLPEAIKEYAISYYLEAPERFNFFAGIASSLATQFRGVAAIKQWLTLSRFHTLPGLLIPTNFNEYRYNIFVDSPTFNFNKKLIASYIVFRKDEIIHIDNELWQHRIKDVETSVDVNGYIKGTVAFEDKSICHFDYSDIVTHNIHPNSILILQKDSSIMLCEQFAGKKYTPYERSHTCKYCGKRIIVPVAGSVKCDNVHCKSNLANSIEQFLGCLNLPMFSVDTIREWVLSDKITCVPDIFVIPEYKDFEVYTTFAKLLRSIVPLDYIRNSAVFEEFANKCSNNLDTIEYYIEHPSKIKTELGMSSMESTRFAEWLCGDYNAVDLQTLLHTSNLKFTDVGKAFDGAPIFRGKTICITGRFRHGSHSRIKEILKSYDAEVSDKFVPTASVLVIGDTNEDNNGALINEFKQSSLPVMTESQFFKQYEIDSDLAQNLV